MALRGVVDLRGFLGLHPHDRFAGMICHTVFFLSLLCFCTHVYGVMSKHRWRPVQQPSQAIQRSPEEVATVAISALLAMFFMITMAQQTSRLSNAAIIYGLFLLTSASLMQASIKGWQGDLVNASWCALLLFATAMLLLLWATVFHGTFIHGEDPLEVDGKFGLMLVGIGLVLALLAVPGILLASLVRRAITALVLCLSRGALIETNHIRRMASWPAGRWQHCRCW